MSNKEHINALKASLMYKTGISRQIVKLQISELERHLKTMQKVNQIKIMKAYK